VADGCTERTDAGLSTFGFKVIERMDRLGILIDLSHSSDLASKETIEASKAPCCFTHTFARSVFKNPRGKPDDLLRLLAKKGGVIGIAAVPNLISNKPVQTIFDVMDHLDYMVKLVGIDHVAIGTDCMYGDHVEMHKHMRGVMNMSKVLDDLPAPAGIRRTRASGQLRLRPRRPGILDEQVMKILGENVPRLLVQTIG
jgi:membrane dipeptidase